MSIDITNLDFSYGDYVIFKNLNLHLPDTGFIVILGQSGSGKTTFLSLLNGFIKPNRGEIHIDKNDLSMVFQSSLLLDYLTLKENVMLPFHLGNPTDKQCIQKADSYISRLHLTELKNKYPYELSGGEMVRTSICRALVKGAKTIILDEPTGQLDESNSNEIYLLLKELSKDHLIIMVTHDEINGIKNANIIYRLENKTLIKETETNHSPTRNKPIEPPTKEKHMSMKSAIFLNKKFLFKKKFRLLFSTIFLAFDMTMIYLGLNLKFHIDKTFQTLMNEYYASEVFSITMEEEVASSGNLHLKKHSIPSDEVLSILYLKEAFYSLDFFIPSINEVTLNNQTKSITFYPSIKQSKNRIKIGRMMEDENEVIVNESFLNEFHIDENKALNSSFYFFNEPLLYTTKFEANDIIQISKRLKIVGISKEKKAFNKAIIYYPYEYILNSFKRITLENISDEFSKDITLYDMIQDSTYDDEDFKSNSLYIYHQNPRMIKENSKKFFQKKVSISSPSIDVEDSTKDIIENLLKVLSLFLILNTFSSTTLLFLIVFSFYKDNLRLFALIKAITRKKENVFINALSMQVIFLTISFSFILFFSITSTLLANQILNKMDYPKFFSVFDFKSFFIIFLLSIFISTISALIPLKKIKEGEINSELEGED